MGVLNETEDLAAATLFVAVFVLFWAELTTLGCLVFAAAVGFTIYAVWHEPVRGVYLALLFLPVTKTFDLPFVGTKLSIVELLVGITVATYVVRGRLSYHRLFEFRYWKLFLLGFLASTVLSGVNAVSLRSYAVEVLSYAYLAGLMLFLTTVLDTEEKRRRAVTTFLISTVAIFLVGAVGYILWYFDISSPFVQGYRLRSTFKAVNQLSLGALTGFFLLLVQTNEARWENVASTAVAMLGVFVLFASGTRMALFSLLPFLLVYTAYEYGFSKSVWPGLVVTAFTALLLLAPPSFLDKKPLSRATSAVDDITAETSSTGEGPGVDVSDSWWQVIRETNEPRYLQLRAFVDIVPEHVVLGVGAGNFKHRMLDYVEHDRSWEMHNTFLAVLAELGLLGFLALTGFLCTVLFPAVFTGVKRYRPAMVALLVGVAAHFVFSMVHFGLRTRHLWVALAFISLLGDAPEQRLYTNGTS